MFLVQTKKKEVVGQGTGDSSTKWCEWCEPISSYEEFLKIRREAREIVDEIRSCDDEERRKELKKKLPAVVYCFPADGNPQGGWLAGSKRPSKLVPFDIDGLESDELRKRVKQVLLAKKDSLRLPFLELSARKHGFHGAVERIDGLSTMQLLQRIDSIIGIEGVETDKSCKDVTRKTFWTSDREEDLIDCDFERMLELSQTPAEYLPNEPIKTKKEKPAKVEKPVEKPSETPAETPKEEATKQSVQIFYDTCQTYGIDLTKLNVEGYRHGIVNDLTGHLAKQMPRAQLEAVYQLFMPLFTTEEQEEFEAQIEWFYQKDADKGYRSNTDKQIFNAAWSSTTTEQQTIEVPEWKIAPPALPPLEELPRPLQLFIKPYPKHLWAPLSVAATVMFNAHASHYRAVYNDGRTIAPPDFCWITNESQSGKFWVEDMKDEMFKYTLAADDKIAWAAHTLNRKERARKSDGKPDKCEQPLNICQTVSQTSVLELMRYQGENGALFCFFPEGSLLAKAKGFKDMTEIQQEGWDGSLHTQYYTTDAAVSCQVRVRLGVLATSTPRVVNQYFRASDNAENGVRNRYMILPFKEEEVLTFHAPRKQPLTSEEQAEMDGYLLKLWKINKALGNDVKMLDMTNCTAAVDAFLDKWKSIYEAGQLTRTEGKMVRRIGQHMLRAAMPYVALFGKETPEIINYINWLGDYVYYYQLQLFAEDQARIDAENQRLLGREHDNRTTQTGGVIYTFDIGTEFTWQEFRDKYINAGGSENSAKQQLKRLCDKENPPVISLGKGSGRYRRIA